MTQLSLFPEPAPSVGKRHTIEFDGGSTCNIPRLGFGDCYGSYRLDGADIVRLTFGVKGSANVGELMTITHALDALACRYDEPTLKTVAVAVTGDSQIALKWAAHPKLYKTEKLAAGSTDQFREAVKRLVSLKQRFAEVRTNWVSRDYMVALFGH